MIQSPHVRMVQVRNEVPPIPRSSAGGVRYAPPPPEWVSGGARVASPPSVPLIPHRSSLLASVQPHQQVMISPDLSLEPRGHLPSGMRHQHRMIVSSGSIATADDDGSFTKFNGLRQGQPAVGIPQGAGSSHPIHARFPSAPLVLNARQSFGEFPGSPPMAETREPIPSLDRHTLHRHSTVSLSPLSPPHGFGLGARVRPPARRRPPPGSNRFYCRSQGTSGARSQVVRPGCDTESSTEAVSESEWSSSSSSDESTSSSSSKSSSTTATCTSDPAGGKGNRIPTRTRAAAAAVAAAAAHENGKRSSRAAQQRLAKRGGVSEEEDWKAKLSRVFAGWGAPPEKAGKKTSTVLTRRGSAAARPAGLPKSRAVAGAPVSPHLPRARQLPALTSPSATPDSSGRRRVENSRSATAWNSSALSAAFCRQGPTTSYESLGEEVVNEEGEDIRRLKLLRGKLRRIQREIELREDRIASDGGRSDERQQAAGLADLLAAAQRGETPRSSSDVGDSDRSFLTFLRQLAKTSPLERRGITEGDATGECTTSAPDFFSRGGGAGSNPRVGQFSAPGAPCHMGGLPFGKEARVFGRPPSGETSFAEPPQLSNGSLLLTPSSSLSGSQLRSSSSRKHRVFLRVYDISEGMAQKWSRYLLSKRIEGIWHSGLVAYGYEYFYSDGILRMRPQDVENTYAMKLCRIHYLGETSKTKESFERFLDTLSPLFCENTYDILEWNCNDFTNICAHWIMGSFSIPQISRSGSRHRDRFSLPLPVSQWGAASGREERMKQIWKAVGHREGLPRAEVIPAYLLDQPAALVKEPVGRLVVSCMRMAQGNLRGVDEVFGCNTFTEACKDAMTRVKAGFEAAIQAVQVESARTAQKVQRAKWCC